MRRFLQTGLALPLLLLCVSLQGAPRVVTGLGVVPRAPPDSPPTILGVVIVDPVTLFKVGVPSLDLPLHLGGAVAADPYGHRLYLTDGGGIEVIDALTNSIEAVVGAGQYYSIKALARRPRLHDLARDTRCDGAGRLERRRLRARRGRLLRAEIAGAALTRALAARDNANPSGCGAAR